MYYARRYAEYKADNHILDFEDLLLKTYDAYRADMQGRLRRYRWIQVDEVQDLNAMQLAIIDLLTAKERATVLFLGDEQQAIFSFMGAKVERLNEIKLRCKGHIHHLRQNHRAPSYLLGSSIATQRHNWASTPSSCLWLATTSKRSLATSKSSMAPRWRTRYG